MSEECFDTPIVFIVFKRPRTTRKVFEVISSIRPGRLLIVADGPRGSVAGEKEACQQVREIVSAVDWPCELSTNFAGENLGCKERIITGLNWAFSLVEEAIILEDDCLPDASFFPFCKEMLARYREDSRVATISGTNLVERYLETSDSYFFGRMVTTWGWATWRSQWQRYDSQLKNWPEIRRLGLLSEVFEESRAVSLWTRVFDEMYENRGVGPNAWDYQWLYMSLIGNALTIFPTVNLVTNIGFGSDATHTTGNDTRLTPAVKALAFPLRHPSHLIPLRSMDSRLQRLHYVPLITRIKGKISRICRRLFRAFQG
ncbi:MAG: hypothetical protein WA700_03055 [Acidobacteriaceae bacterium]